LQHHSHYFSAQGEHAKEWFLKRRTKMKDQYDLSKLRSRRNLYMPTAASSTSVQEFLDQFSATSERIANDLIEYLGFLKHSKREYKSIREEHIPIRAYLLREGIPLDAIIELGGEAHPFDAKIRLANVAEEDSIVLEVVQALPVNEHRVRHALVKGRMDEELRELEKEQLQSFPLPIIEAIRKKHSRSYADKRVLLVSVTGEHTGEDDKLIEEWIQVTRQNTSLGKFVAIFLVETARYKLFKLH
jgi:hypothetical protein